MVVPKPSEKCLASYTPSMALSEASCLSGRFLSNLANDRSVDNLNKELTI